MSVSIAQCLGRAVELEGLSDTPRLDLELLLCHCLQQERVYLYTWPEREVTEQQLGDFEALLARRRLGEPVAYLVGRRDFWNLSLAVDAGGLIPRPDTELLVELALERAPMGRTGRALDLGTGTGALILALASERPHWQLLGVDNSEAALRLAERNRHALGFGSVAFVRGNWFQALDAKKPFDLILSNPPYIAPDDPHLEQGDLRFEPRSALVAEQNGLADISQIVQTAPNYLEPGGWLLIEHGWQQGATVRELFQKAGFKAVASHRDLAGRERVTLGCH